MLSDAASSRNSDSAQPSIPTVPKTSEERATTFRPVEGGNELQSGGQLLVEAYAAVWLVLFALVLISWRRLRGIETRIAYLEGRLVAEPAQPGLGSSEGHRSA